MEQQDLVEESTVMPSDRGDPLPRPDEEHVEAGVIESRINDLIGQLERSVVAGEASAGEALRSLGRVKTRVASMACRLARDAAEASPSVEPADLLRREMRLGWREANQLSRISAFLADMPTVTERFASARIALGHVNTLVNAAEKVGSAVVDSDGELLAVAGRTLPDTFYRHAVGWWNDKLADAGVDLLGRQIMDREARLWVDHQTGMGVLNLRLAPPQFNRVKQAIENHQLGLLRQDGHDARPPEMVRTPRQRKADAVFELITGLDSVTGDPIASVPGGRVRASTQLVVVADQGVVDGTAPGGQVEIVGTGPVPREFLATLSPDTELAGMIYGQQGRVLWLGRNQRLANVPQRLAVAVRDGGCFACGAPMHMCDLHHVQPWREGGVTDVDNLVATCRTHHKWVDDKEVVLERRGDRWVVTPHPEDGSRRPQRAVADGGQGPVAQGGGGRKPG